MIKILKLQWTLKNILPQVAEKNLSGSNFPSPLTNSYLREKIGFFF